MTCRVGESTSGRSPEVDDVTLDVEKKVITHEFQK
jgi:hypothetical protein